MIRAAELPLDEQLTNEGHVADIMLTRAAACALQDARRPLDIDALSSALITAGYPAASRELLAESLAPVLKAHRESFRCRKGAWMLESS